MKVGLIGAGKIASMHIGAYKMIPEVEFVAITDINEERLNRMRQKYQINTYRDLDDMLLKEKLDMIDICTPTYLHADQAIKAMNNKVNVLCEKPIALNPDDARSIAEATERNGVFFMAAQVIRFCPEYNYLKKTFDEKKYGELHQICMSRICMLSPDSWANDSEKSGGAALDLHIHDMDFLIYLLGKPKSVSSQIKYVKNQVDSISTHYQYDGPVAEAQAGWYAAPIPFSSYFRASFENAVIEYKNDVLMLYEVGKTPVTLELEKPMTFPSEANIDKLNGYYHEIVYFTDCIKRNRKPEIITIDQSIQCLEVIFKEMESAKTGNLIVL